MTNNTAPVVQSVTFDQPGYAPGSTVTATVTYTAGTQAVPFTFSDAITDTASGLTGTLSAVFTVTQPDSTSHAPADNGSRAWTLASDNGSQAVFTAIA